MRLRRIKYKAWMAPAFPTVDRCCAFHGAEAWKEYFEGNYRWQVIHFIYPGENVFK